MVKLKNYSIKKEKKDFRAQPLFKNPSLLGFLFCGLGVIVSISIFVVSVPLLWDIVDAGSFVAWMVSALILLAISGLIRSLAYSGLLSLKGEQKQKENTENRNWLTISFITSISSFWIVYFFYATVARVQVNSGTFHAWQGETEHAFIFALLLMVLFFPLFYELCLIIYLGRKYSIASLSEAMIEWRNPNSRKRYVLQTSNISNLERISYYSAVFKLYSGEKIKWSFSQISPEDRKEIKKHLLELFDCSAIRS